jgi:hypothetical protein
MSLPSPKQNLLRDCSLEPVMANQAFRALDIYIYQSSNQYQSIDTPALFCFDCLPPDAVSQEDEV